MSDYTANRIKIRGSQAELAYARHVLYDMDFDKIAPCPKTLMIESGSMDRYADLAFLYTIYGNDPAKAIQNGQNPQMINIIYPTWQKNYARDIQGFKEDVTDDGNDGAGFSFGGLSVVSGDETEVSKNPKSCADLAALGRIRYMNYLKYGHTGWYDWRNENWGVKWNAVYPEVETGDDFVSYGFGTPWCMPDGIFKIFEKLLSPTGLEVIWAFAFTKRGCDCGYFMKKSDENKFVYTDKEGEAAFADSIWERDDWFHIACAAE